MGEDEDKKVVEMPSVAYCPYCGGRNLKFVGGVPRCMVCRSVFFVQFSRTMRKPIGSRRIFHSNTRVKIQHGKQEDKMTGEGEMRNKGLSQHRFKNNPLERKFADAWESINSPFSGGFVGRGVLDYLLAGETNNPRGEVSDRDREVAATVIQWLGSPVGQGFVRDVLSADSKGA